MTNPTDNFFGGAPGLSWPGPVRQPDGTQLYTDRTHFNVIRGGVIVDEPVIQQMTEMGTGVPLFWDQEKTRPKQQLVVTLLCDGSRGGALNERNPQSPSDDGRRKLYVKSYMRNAIQDALREAGAPGLRIGSELYVAWTGEQPSKTPKFAPSRTWHAKYVPGSVALPEGGSNTGQPGAQGANPFGGQPAPAPVPQQTTQADPWGSAPQAPPAQQPVPVNPFGGQVTGPPAGQPVQAPPAYNPQPAASPWG